jgi:hypothetical protein
MELKINKNMLFQGMNFLAVSALLFSLGGISFHIWMGTSLDYGKVDDALVQPGSWDAG